MKLLDLFSGIGGISLAAEWARMETVAFCEIEPFCQKVLKKHWPHVPIYDDVRTLTKARLDADGIGTIDIICGGDPCQPYSLTGEREGEGDDRYLWPEVKRILEDFRPRWYVRENVIGNITLGLDKTLSDLESIGYTARTFDIPACAVDAVSERRRIFVIAHSNSQRLSGRALAGSCGKMWERAQEQFSRLLPPNPRPKISAADFSRKGYGVSRRMDERRLIALGNAVDPYQIYPILKAIQLIDEGA